MKRFISALLFIAFVLPACSQPTPEVVKETVIVRVTEPPAPTYTAYPTYTAVPPAPTYTLLPTHTPQEPLPTSTPRPTYTPYPTYTKPAKPTNTPRPTSTPTPEAPAFGSRSNPVPFGETFSLIMGQEKKFRLSVIDFVRGQEAWDRILATNRYNDPPPSGMEYIMLFLQVDYYEGPDDEPLELNFADFKVVSKGQIVDYESVIEPDPEFDISFFPGASGGGWLAWPVYPDDADPLLVIGMDYSGRGGFYFATHS